MNKQGSNPNIKQLEDLLSPDWAAALKPVEQQIHNMGDFLRQEHQQGHETTPTGHDILRAFTKPLSNVKVLIVGQDPYPTQGYAMGLSFSVTPETQPLPASLKNIFTELKSDLGLPEPHNGDLSAWFDQGVLLLNRVLTTRVGQPSAHKNKGWEVITEEAVRALFTQEKPLVAILWGNDARNLKPLIQSQRTPNNTVIMESVHPSPLSAHRGFFGSQPFSKTNAALEAMKQEPINWALS